MKNLIDLLKQAGFSRRSIAQAMVCGITLAIIATLATGLATDSALAVAAGGFVVALVVITIVKVALGLLRGSNPGDGGEGNT
jgi:hypothetical protein